MSAMKDLRVHHILCTSNYEGKGYSDAFCDNMSAVVDRLRSNPDEKLHLVAQPDMICRNCPNKTTDHTCAHDGNKIVAKDQRIAERLGLVVDGSYTYRTLCKITREQMTPELFTELCGVCSWHAQGLCKYEYFLDRLDACIFM